MAVPVNHLAQKQRANSPRVIYPQRDGKLMGETDRHVHCILDAIQALEWYYADRDDVYIAGNNFIYFEEGNPRARVSPDTYVVFGVPKGFRDTYFTWKNGGRLPSVVIEFTSKETRREDHGRKKQVYETQFGAPEYFIFDPRAEYQKPRLQGFRLIGASYEPIPNNGGRMNSGQLHLDLVEEGDRLRFFEPARGRWLPTAIEESRRADREATRADHEAERAERESQARLAAEAETERLRAQLEALKRERGA
jgi:Uma2 family endonuclease